MPNDPDAEIDNILNAHAQRQNARKAATQAARSDALAFREWFEGAVAEIIWPALRKIEAKLHSRGKPCRIECRERAEAADGRVRRASIAIYFDEQNPRPLRAIAPQVEFSGDENRQVVVVYGSAMSDQGGGSAGPRGDLSKEEVSESSVSEHVLDVLSQYYNGWA